MSGYTVHTQMNILFHMALATLYSRKQSLNNCLFLYNRGCIWYWWRLYTCSLGGAHAMLNLDLYPAACSNYMMVKEQFTKNNHCADGNKSSKSNKYKQLMLLVNVLQLGFKITVSLCLHPLFPLCISSQHSTAMTGQLILTLSPSTMMTARAAGSRSLTLHALVWECVCLCVCVWTHSCVDCWDRSH